MVLPSLGINIRIDNFIIERGAQHLACVNIDTEGESEFLYSGFQFDVNLPEDITIAEISLDSSLSGFTLESNYPSERVFRCVAYANSSAATNLTKQIAIITFEASKSATDGKKTIGISNAMLCSPDAEDIRLNDSSVTATIEGLFPPINVSLSEQYLIVKDGDSVNFWVKATGGNPDGWAYSWTQDGNEEVLSHSDTLNVTAHNKNPVEPVIKSYVANVTNVKDGMLVFNEEYRFTLEIWSMPVLGGDSEGEENGGNGTKVSAIKIREGNLLTVSVELPSGGYKNEWNYLWSDGEEEIGRGQTITLTASLPNVVAQGIEKGTADSQYNVTMTNYGPDNSIWTETKLTTHKVTVYKRPSTPLQLLRKGDGKSCTFIIMTSLNDALLASNGYYFVYGYTDGNGTDHLIEKTSLRYVHTSNEIYNNPDNRFWAYSVWIYNDGSAVSSGLRYLDGSADENFDGSIFDGSTKGEVVPYDEIEGVFTPEGRYVGKAIRNVEPGIYIVKNQSSSLKVIVN